MRQGCCNLSSVGRDFLFYPFERCGTWHINEHLHVNKENGSHKLISLRRPMAD